MKLTAIIHDAGDGWLAGQIAEYPAAISQGQSLNELKANLLDALSLLFEVEREQTLSEAEKPFYTEVLALDYEASKIPETSEY